MRTEIIGSGHIGRFKIKNRRFFLNWKISIEPSSISALYKIFHGLGYSLIFEKKIGSYKSHDIRTSRWEQKNSTDIWENTRRLWYPVIDLVNELEFLDNISFLFHPYRIEWFCTFPINISKEKSKTSIEMLHQKFETLGFALQKILTTT